ncbi:MAG: ArsR/SmtB family transcription factor [Lachnospiraceae bacterium]|uniref:ArsR/SmtB family transcription factor n=1 Tax=Parablautia sp. Marseille-Q6255 TaxID=3039593 RepID=UPI0024BCF14F|nr:ArsR family transcriptional regulator [Parablautia sp. Marseille-Q6255]
MNATETINSGKINRHIALTLDDPNHYRPLEIIGKALSSPVRLKMLYLLKNDSLNIIELAQALQIPVSSAAFHVNLLEEAGLITAEILPGVRGSQKVCSSRAQDIHIAINTASQQTPSRSFSVDMPIGNYFDFKIHPTCGMVDENTYIESCDDVRAFYSPRRISAQLIWFHKGFIEYRFPNHFLIDSKPTFLSFSLEICSEAPGYRNVWPSDITFFINDVELLTYTSPGDFGGRHGKLTPAWWTDGNTQYGLLKTIGVSDKGVSLDGILITDNITIDSLSLPTMPYISFKIAIKEDAIHTGGINIFGKSYGDYSQNIIMYIDTQN